MSRERRQLALFHWGLAVVFAAVAACTFLLTDYKNHQTRFVLQLDKSHLGEVVHVWWDDSRGYKPNRSRKITDIDKQTRTINFILPAVVLREIKIVSERPLLIERLEIVPKLGDSVLFDENSELEDGNTVLKLHPKDAHNFNLRPDVVRLFGGSILVFLVVLAVYFRFARHRVSQKLFDAGKKLGSSTVFNNFRSQNSKRSIAFFLAATLLLTVGVFFRSLGMFGEQAFDFWVDEALWAPRLMDPNWLSHLSFRPIGYMYLSRLVVETLGDTESSYRLLSWIGSLVALVVLAVVAHKCIRNLWVALFSVFLLSVNPVLIDYAREFKPYGFETGVHAILLYALLLFCRSNSKIVAYFLGACIVFAPIFAINTVFALPALCVVGTIELLRRREGRGFLWGSLVVIASFAILGTMFVLIWSKIDPDVYKSFWGQKYNTFVIVESDIWWKALWTRVTWLSGKLYDLYLLSFPVFKRPDAWLKVLASLSFVFTLLSLCLGVRSRKSLSLVSLYVIGVLAFVILFNQLGRWPFGDFRTNIFLVPFAILLFALSLDHWTRLNSWTRYLVYGFMTMVVFGWIYSEKFKSHSIRQVIAHTEVTRMMEIVTELEDEALESRDGLRPAVIFDRHASVIAQYYLSKTEAADQKRNKHLKDKFDLEFLAERSPNLIEARMSEFSENRESYCIISSSRGMRNRLVKLSYAERYFFVQKLKGPNTILCGKF